MRLIRYLLGISLIAGCLYCFMPDAMPFVSYKKTLEPAEILKNGPNSYYVSVPLDTAYPLLIASDHPRQTASNLIVTENGKPLGPPRSSHQDIAELGSGRFSHWGTTGSSVIFSTSDNTDPRTNGRTYTVSARPQVPLLFFVVVVLPFVILLLQRLISGRWLVSFQAAAVVIVFVAWARMLSGLVIVSPDSPTYVYWLPVVPLGYPLFLSAIGSLAWVPIVQLVAMAAASLFLSLAVNRISRAAGLATLLVLLCYTPMFYGQAGIISEALLLPLLLANVGSAIFLIAGPCRRRHAILLALTAALIMFVRPAGYFAPLGIAFLLIAHRSRFWWLVKWAAAPFVAFLIVTLLITFAIRGTASQSQVGRILFPQVAFLFDPQIVAESDRHFALAIDDAMRPHRILYTQAQTMEDRFRFSRDNFNRRLSDTDFAIYRRFAALDIAEHGVTDSATYLPRLERIYLRFFSATIANRPLEYLAVVREQLFGAWMSAVLHYNAPFEQIFRADAKGSRSRIQTIEEWKLPIDKGLATSNLATLEQWPGTVIALLDKIFQRIQSQRWLTYVAGIVTLLAIPLAILSSGWLVLGYCGVIVHGSILLTSAVTVFIQRYAFPIDPVMLVAGVIIFERLLFWGWQRLIGWRRGLRIPGFRFAQRQGISGS